MSDDQDAELQEQLMAYLIQQLGGSVRVHPELVERWLDNPRRYVYEQVVTADGHVSFEVRELPEGEPEELMGEAAGLLGSYLHNDDEVDSPELERALWLLSHGRLGSPRHDEFPLNGV